MEIIRNIEVSTNTQIPLKLCVCVCACMRVYVRIHLHMNKLYTCIFVYVRSRNVMGRSRQCCTGGLCHESETIPPLIQSSRIKQVRLKHCKCSILSKKKLFMEKIYIYIYISTPLRCIPIKGLPFTFDWSKNSVEVGGVVVGMMNFVGNPLDSMA